MPRSIPSKRWGKRKKCGKGDNDSAGIPSVVLKSEDGNQECNELHSLVNVNRYFNFTIMGLYFLSLKEGREDSDGTVMVLGYTEEYSKDMGFVHITGDNA